MNVLHAALYSDTSINKYYEKKALLMRITQLKKNHQSPSIELLKILPSTQKSLNTYIYMSGPRWR